MTKIIDDFLPESLYKNILDALSSAYMPWYFNTETSTIGYTTFVDEKTEDVFQFTHRLFFDNKKESELWDLVKQILLVFDIQNGTNFSDNVIRAKINMLCKQCGGSSKYHTPHIDADITEFPSYKTLLFYVNDADGDTFIFNEGVETKEKNLSIQKTISPKANRIVFFDSTKLHASSSPMHTDRRIVINFVVKV